MNESTRDLIYKHITKLPWIGMAVWTALLAWGFQQFPTETYSGNFLRLFLFGLSFHVGFYALDDHVAVKFRRKVLLSTPGLRAACIQNILEEAGVYSTEVNDDEDKS